jgi:hypothetical protein
MADEPYSDRDVLITMINKDKHPVERKASVFETLSRSSDDLGAVAITALSRRALTSLKGFQGGPSLELDSIMASVVPVPSVEILQPTTTCSSKLLGQAHRLSGSESCYCSP